MLHRFEHSSIFEYHSEDEAINLLKQAKGMPYCIRRDELLRKAGQMDVATHINEWLSSPGLQLQSKARRVRW
jgi:hypothetical protein